VPDCTVTKYVARTQAPELTVRSLRLPHMPRIEVFEPSFQGEPADGEGYCSPKLRP
jgi:hypothetical protein